MQGHSRTSLYFSQLTKIVVVIHVNYLISTKVIHKLELSDRGEFSNSKGEVKQLLGRSFRATLREKFSNS